MSESMMVILNFLNDILNKPNLRSRNIERFKYLVWLGIEDMDVKEILRDLARDLDLYEPNEVKRKMNLSYYGAERLEEEVRLALKSLRLNPDFALQNPPRAKARGRARKLDESFPGHAGSSQIFPAQKCARQNPGLPCPVPRFARPGYGPGNAKGISRDKAGKSHCILATFGGRAVPTRSSDLPHNPYGANFSIEKFGLKGYQLDLPLSMEAAGTKDLS